MNRCCGLIWVVVALTGNPARADFRSWMYPPEPDVIANTDVFEANIANPAPGHPVYYLPVARGYRDFGFPAAGEKIPEPAGVLRMVTKILESQGYQLATTEHAPTIILLYAWGNFYLNPDPMVRNNFSAQMLEFLGADKLGFHTDARSNRFPEFSAGLTPMRPDASTVSGFLPHGMYVITFWAFDFGLAMKGEARLLWKTNISSSTRGFYLPEVLPTMLTVAAPLIGRETNRPIRIDVAKHYEPAVELGPLQVIDDDVKDRAVH